ncbi:AAA family ATPase [Desulfovibrio sp. OttesenSCG-928-O18]|nr:AAA family ATPase [Desulfovibrio sp. OttesenSCG-928-O18]
MTAISTFAVPSFLRRSKKKAPCLMDSPEMRYMRSKAAFWLMNATTSGAALDSSFFACLEWVSGPIKPFIAAVTKAAKAAPVNVLTAKDKKEVLSTLAGPSSRVSRSLDDIVEEYPAFRPAMVELTVQACRNMLKTTPPQPKPFSNAIRLLQKTFGCSVETATLCEFIYILRNVHQVENYFEDSINVHKSMNIRLLAHILGMSAPRLTDALSEIGLHGIRHTSYDNFHLHDAVEKFWSPESPQALSALFCRPLKGDVLPLSAFRLDAADVAYTASLLAASDDEPVHLLLYGPPGTGKTTFAASLARELGVKAWSVTSRVDDDEGDRRASLMACVHMASKHPGAFVVVDEAERLLDTDNSAGKNTKDKAWLNGFMEAPGRRVIWISNQVAHIDHAVRRRFSFSLFFDSLNTAERTALWRQILAKQRVASRMSPENVERLAASYPVSAAVVTGAVRQAKRLGSDKKQFADAVERALKAHQVLSRDGRKKTNRNRAEDAYTLEGVSMEGSAHDLLARCRRMDTLMKEEKGLPPGGGTMLFYGPPGTGKTALARYLAKELHRECLVKRASDLLSPYVGVSEYLVAEAFAGAEKAGALLVIDEADSFLFSRDIAQHSWETTMVNEFLTNLEECRTICVCTTNRRDNMDAAAMRRFSFKIPFAYAKPEQLRALYASLLAPLAKGRLAGELETRLIGCANLAPGDFHAVRGQYWLTDPNSVSHDELVGALLREQKMKLEKNTRRVGF